MASLVGRLKTALDPRPLFHHEWSCSRHNKIMTPSFLAFCLLRIPRLFVSLFMWPIIIGLTLVAGQTLVSFSIIQYGNEDAESYRERREQAHDFAWLRGLVYGSEGPVPSLIICRWIDEGLGSNLPPSPGCAIEESDVALRVGNPATAVVDDFVRLFDGATPRLHVCKRCSGAITVDLTASAPQSSIESTKGLGVYLLSRNEVLREFGTQVSDGRVEMDRLEALSGDVSFYSASLPKAVNLAESKTRLVLVLNVAMVVVVAFWLGIRAHRKVLDYFVKNGVLLPLVASCGKDAVYRALWLLSLARTLLFLTLSSFPLYLSFGFAVRRSSGAIFENDSLVWGAWLLGLAIGLGVLTIIVSTADLRERGSWYMALVRFVPLSVWSIGTLVWLASIVGDSPAAVVLRNIVSATPVAGLSAILLAPVVEPHVGVFVAHAGLSLALIVYILRSNTNYFAAHIEEL